MSRLMLRLCLCCLAAPAWSMRCAGGIISEGDSTLLVRKRCGTDKTHWRTGSGGMT